MPKIVVITGAGVCRATLREFAQRGCHVALLSRDPQRLEAAAAEARARGVHAPSIPTDVADAAAVEAAAERVERELGPIDVRVNVATRRAICSSRWMAPMRRMGGSMRVPGR